MSVSRRHPLKSPSTSPAALSISCAADDLARRLRPLLSGSHPIAIGLVLADLTACWLAGHAPATRAGLLDMHMTAIAELTPVEAARIARENGLPDTWAGSSGEAGS